MCKSLLRQKRKKSLLVYSGHAKEQKTEVKKVLVDVFCFSLCISVAIYKKWCTHLTIETPFKRECKTLTEVKIVYSIFNVWKITGQLRNLGIL